MSKAQDITEIIPNLFMGGEGILPIPPDGFDLVVSCREIADILVPSLKDILEQGGPVLLSVKMLDAPIEVPAWKIRSTAAYIAAVYGQSKEGYNTGKRVLIHCKQGLNRSALILCAFLIMYLGYTVDDAIAFVREKRPGALGNETFVKMLKSL
jgi:protein-tyrosine phosphatase